MMSTWVDAALTEAAATLSQYGKPELAALLDRLSKEPDIQALRLYRSLDVAALADELYDCECLDGCLELIRWVAAAFDVQHCTIHCVRERSTAFYSTKVLTTFPQDWVADYVGRRYSTIDPVVARCRSGTGLFFWDELSANDPIVKHFTKSCIQSGIGPSGVTYVDQVANGGTIGVTLCSTLDHAVFRESFGPKLADFAAIAQIMIEVFTDLACEKNEALFNPTDDQLKVLRALAAGRAPFELDDMHFTFGSLYTIKKSILKSFGAKTLAQATAIAANMGLLEDLPYFEEDIYLSKREHDIQAA